MTGPDYIGWVTRDMVEYFKFKPLNVEFPELSGKAHGWDATMITSRIGRWAPLALAVTVAISALLSISGGDVPFIVIVAVAVLAPVAFQVIMSTSAVVFAFKMADELSLTQIMAELDRMQNLVPSPGQLDVFEYYGGLVLVFEKPLPPGKRDRMIAMRRTSALARCVTDIYVAELDAGTVFNVGAPWNVKKFVPVLTDSLGQTGTPPRLQHVEAGVGQRTRLVSPAFVSIGLVALMAFFHIVVHLDRTESLMRRMVEFGAMNSPRLTLGEYWRLVTSIFLHWDIGHLAMNLIMLFEYGRAVEPLFGGGWTMTLFLLTGIAGNLLMWSVYGMAGVPVAAGAGASGSVMGFAGVLVAIYLFRRDMLTARFRTHFWTTAILFGGFQFLWGFSQAGNLGGDLAHLGGFLAGFAAGSVLPFKEGSKAPWKGPWLGLAAAGVAVWAAVAGSARSGWAPERYDKIENPAAAVAVECPEGWVSYVDPEERVTELLDLMGNRVVFAQGGEQIEGILGVPDWQLRESFEKDYRERWRMYKTGGRDHVLVSFEIGDFAVEHVTISGGAAISVRCRVTQKVETRLYMIFPEVAEEGRLIEMIYLPRSSGFLWALFDADVRDYEYNKPALARIRQSIISTDSPSVPAVSP
jgi:rhomboid protease GluP